MRLLLISSSLVHGYGFLDQPAPFLREHLGTIRTIAFVPFAAHDHDAYTAKANRALNTQTRAIAVLGGLVLELLKYGQPATQTVVYKHVSIEAGAQAMLGPAQTRHAQSSSGDHGREDEDDRRNEGDAELARIAGRPGGLAQRVVDERQEPEQRQARPCQGEWYEEQQEVVNPDDRRCCEAGG